MKQLPIAPMFLAIAFGLLCHCFDTGSHGLAQTEDRETTKTADSQERPVSLPNCYQFELRSKTNRDYRIFVANPSGTKPDNGWPVIYLTDGNSNFSLLVAAVERQSRGGRGAVVVGIGYPTDDFAKQRLLRSYDLTPATSETWLKTRARGMSDLPTGGNDEFLSFLNDELKPVIVSKFPIDRSRQALFGHSFGGLFVLHVLFTRPESFQTYLATSPSIWWNDGSILKEEQQFLKRFSTHSVDARLLVSVGELEKTSRIDAANRANELKQRQIVGSAEELVQRLSAAKIDGLKVMFREFAEEQHGSVVFPAASRGVRFALTGM